MFSIEKQWIKHRSLSDLLQGPRLYPLLFCSFDLLALGGVNHCVFVHYVSSSVHTRFVHILMYRDAGISQFMNFY